MCTGHMPNSLKVSFDGTKGKVEVNGAEIKDVLEFSLQFEASKSIGGRFYFTIKACANQLAVDGVFDNLGDN